MRHVRPAVTRTVTVWQPCVLRRARARPCARRPWSARRACLCARRALKFSGNSPGDSRPTMVCLLLPSLGKDPHSIHKLVQSRHAKIDLPCTVDFSVALVLHLAVTSGRGWQFVRQPASVTVAEPMTRSVPLVVSGEWRTCARISEITPRSARLYLRRGQIIDAIIHDAMPCRYARRTAGWRSRRARLATDRTRHARGRSERRAAANGANCGTSCSCGASRARSRRGRRRRRSRSCETCCQLGMRGSWPAPARTPRGRSAPSESSLLDYHREFQTRVVAWSSFARLSESS